MSEQMRKTLEIKRKNEKNWLSIEGVAAIGVGMIEEKTGIIISVTTDPAIIRRQIPPRVEGVTVVVQQSGDFRAQ